MWPPLLLALSLLPLGARAQGCTAQAGYGCAGAATTATLCPVGSYCPGGNPAPVVECYPTAACPVAGLAAQPPCYWNVSTLAGAGVAGYADGQGTAARFMGPAGVAIEPTTLNALVVDLEGDRLRRVTPLGLVSTLAGSGARASTNAPGIAAAFNAPFGVALDPAGNAIIAEFGGHCVRKVTPAGVVTTLAGSGTIGGANGIGAVVSFSGPTGVTLDSTATTAYIVEQNNGNRIRRLTLSTGQVATLAGSGTPGFADHASNGLLAQFNWPTAAVWHTSGVLYVTDFNNHRIRPHCLPHSHYLHPHS